MGVRSKVADALAPVPGPAWQQLVAAGAGVAATVVVGRLMTRLRTLTQAYEASEQRYRSLFDHNPDAVFTVDPHGRFTSVNEAGERLLGVGSATLIGRPFIDWIAPAEVGAVDARFRAALGGQPQQYELTVVDGLGRHTATLVSSFPVLVDGEVVGVQGLFKDISERKALEQRLTHAALHDPLTGLANRALLADRLEHAVALSGRAEEPVALLLLDLDGFKPINDTHGHAVGDLLLVEIAERLHRVSRPADTLARLGGDEFAVVLPGADEAAAAAVARRVLEIVAEPVTVDRATLVVGASIGLVVGDAASSGDELLRDADLAMYAAKHRGRGRYEVFGAEMDPAVGTGTVLVACHEARDWAGYMQRLRAEIAEQKEAGGLPETVRGPASMLRVLQSLLASIDTLPVDAEQGQLVLPERTQFEEFVYHQTMVHDWADDLAVEGILTTRRTPDAERFWADMQRTMLGPRVGNGRRARHAPWATSDATNDAG